MSFRFLEPAITAEEGVLLRPNVAQPDVYTGYALAHDPCRAIAATILDGHAAGQSWESRTRYAPGAQASWDVSRRFRSSRNISTDLAGLDKAYAAMEAEARNAFTHLGLDPGRDVLQRVDEQCLIYGPGDHISDHADDAAMYVDAGGAAAWHVIKPQRHLVGVMWLTDQTDDGAGAYEFAGGELRFNSLVDEETGEALVVRPTAGKMVVFPANAWFRHEVLQVRAGIRLALTRWWEVVAAHAPS